MKMLHNFYNFFLCLSEFSGDVPCPDLLAECIHIAVCVQRVAGSCQCQVKMTEMLRRQKNATNQDKPEHSDCSFDVHVFVSVVQAYSPVLHFSIFVQRSFP